MITTKFQKAGTSWEGGKQMGWGEKDMRSLNCVQSYLALLKNNCLKQMWQKIKIWQNFLIDAWMFFKIFSLLFRTSKTLHIQTENQWEQTKKGKLFVAFVFLPIFGNKIVQLSGGIWIFSYSGVSVWILNFVVSSLNFLLLILNSKTVCAVWSHSLRKPNYLLSLHKYLDRGMELLQQDVWKYYLVACLMSKLSVRSSKHETQDLSRRERTVAFKHFDSGILYLWVCIKFLSKHNHLWHSKFLGKKQ